ncbi:unnamed protein product [Fraxinus pennsylvanica]|uniref:Reticulon-like protein n=1 Tax=Fraxinus pennsylvanica TaxID=56036 RepID=A0AAD1ZFJ4_9LAMI|nr:unnamed protein product [Fraxinus pennsylvanica]
MTEVSNLVIDFNGLRAVKVRTIHKKAYVQVVAGLWVLSIVGSWCNFLTLFYILFVLLHTLPVLYEKYDDKIDAFAEKAMIEIKKQYAILDAKVLSKIPRGPLKDKKRA